MRLRDLFLIRHGKAVDAAPDGDAARPLTLEGRRDIAAVGGALAAFGVAPDAIWHSPYARTTETAVVLGAALGAGPLVSEGLLTPMSSAERAMQALLHAPVPTLLAVSHMPLLPALLEELIGARVEFSPGTVAHIGLLGPQGAVLLGLWTAEKLAHVR